MWIVAPGVTAAPVPSAGLTALGFGATGFSLPYTVFTPTTWAVDNTRGAPASAGAITPGLLNAAQANLTSTINNSLASVGNQGAWEFAGIASLFAGWGETLGQIGTTNARAFETSVNKSAKGCSGFLSCLFG